VKFTELDIPEPVLKGIAAAGFTQCTPVQEATLPRSLNGEDIAAQAQTGTGKTAAFLITLLSRMIRYPLNGTEKPGAAKTPRSPQALVIAPTRELVVQIKAEAELLGQYTGLGIQAVFGGIDYEKQRQLLRQGPDILVGTPGRLIDYLKQRVYSLKATRFIVIDEADRMFDMGFIKDLRYLLRKLPPFDQRQSMLFSATLSHRVMELCYEHMNLTDRVSLSPERVTVDAVVQELYHVGKVEKFGLLLGLVQREKPERTLIFVNTKVTAAKLVARLAANGFPASDITGDRPQKVRLNILRRFKEGTIPFLVATDVASRGLHIDGVTHVINYDLPQDPEDYVHRIGRTARAGATGKAISLACEEYVYSLADIEDYIHQKIPVQHADEELVVKNYKAGQERKRRSGPAQRAEKRGRRSGAGKSGGGQGVPPDGGKKKEPSRRGRPRRKTPGTGGTQTSR